MKVTYTRGDKVQVPDGYGKRTGTVYTVYEDGTVSVILDGPNPLSTTNRESYNPMHVERIACEG